MFCKTPKISPGAYIFQRPILRGLYSEGLIYRGKFALQNQPGLYNCIGSEVCLKAYSWKEIYGSNLQQVFTETRLEDVDLSKTQPCKYLVYIYGPKIWQMQKFMCYCTVFALFYFEFEDNFRVQALGGLYLEGQFIERFFLL